MKGTVLIIDDEPLIRTLFSRLIVRLGLEFLAAADGTEGVATFEEHQQAIDLVILDMKMPDFTGDAVFKMLRKIAPNIPILLSTGYTEDEAIEDLLSLGRASFIQKPFTLDVLKPKLAEYLSE